MPETTRPDVILYTRQGCHLCDEAHDILRRHGLRPRLVDIDLDEKLQRQFNVYVPVVTINGQERFRGRVNEVLLQRLLNPRTAQADSASGRVHRHLAIFAKYWEPGQSKTRLAVTLGEARAAELSRCFLTHLLTRFRSEYDSRTVVYSPDDRREAFLALRDDAAIGAGCWEVQPQGEGDLGARLERFLTRVLEREAEKVIVLGSDMPTIPAEWIDRTWRALDQVPVVLGPAEDGGYYLLGVSGDVPPIFTGIDWGSSRVLRQTVERLARHQICYHVLDPGYDIDRPEDLARLLAELADSASESSPDAARLRRRIESILNSSVHSSS
jgi:uncharacterized protein